MVNRIYKFCYFSLRGAYKLAYLHKKMEKFGFGYYHAEVAYRYMWRMRRMFGAKKMYAYRWHSNSILILEPEWVEVVTEMLLSLLSQESHLVRVVVTNVFKILSPHMTTPALDLVINVSYNNINKISCQTRVL